MCALIPWRKAGVGESPFVLVFNSIGIPYAGDIMKFRGAHGRALRLEFRPVRLHAHGVVDGQRRHDSALVRQTNRRGVPMLALCAAMAGGLLALLSSVIAASTVYLVLVALSGLSAVGGVDRHRLLPDRVPSPLAGVRPFHQRTQIPHARLSVRVLGGVHPVHRIVRIGDFRRGATVRARGRARVHRGLLWGVFPATVGTQAQKATEADDLDTLWVARD